jgi:predicted lipoprotein with Yx(FWY)xxD motif
MPFTTALAIASVVVVAACGGAGSGAPAATQPPVAAASTPYAPPAPPSTSQDTSGGYGDYYGYGTPAPKAAGPTGPLLLTDSAKLGKVLAASNGMTLYTNKNDTPKSSACNNACAQIWPPLVTMSGAPAAPAGLKGTLGVVTWSDGTVQVTLNGMPLYLYAGDSKSGDANGDGIDGIWSAAKN